MGFHWRLSDIKSPQVSSTFLSIQAYPRNVVVFMVFQFPYEKLGDRSECKMSNWYHCHFHITLLFSFPARSKYLSVFSFFSIVRWVGNIYNGEVLLSFVFIYLSIHFVIYNQSWSNY